MWWPSQSKPKQQWYMAQVWIQARRPFKPSPLNIVSVISHVWSLENESSCRFKGVCYDGGSQRRAELAVSIAPRSFPQLPGNTVRVGQYVRWREATIVRGAPGRPLPHQPTLTSPKPFSHQDLLKISNLSFSLQYKPARNYPFLHNQIKCYFLLEFFMKSHPCFSLLFQFTFPLNLGKQLISILIHHSQIKIHIFMMHEFCGTDDIGK